MKRAFVCPILRFMPVRPATPSHARRLAAGPRLAESVQVRAALEWFDRNLSWINDAQARLTEIPAPPFQEEARARDRKSTRLNSSHGYISYAVFCLKKKKKQS